MEKVFVVVYHDPEDGYVGMDVYGTYEHAVERFNKAVSALESEEETIDILLVDAEDSYPYLKTESGYEVFVRVESVQREVSTNS